MADITLPGGLRRRRHNRERRSSKTYQTFETHRALRQDRRPPPPRHPRNSTPSASFRSRGRRLADLVDAVRVEGEVILDLRHRIKGSLITPHRIDGTIPAGRNAGAGSVALVGEIRRVLATRARGHLDVTV